MQDSDAFLTRTIVGAPRTARLGRRVAAPATAGSLPELQGSPWIRALEDEPPAVAPAAPAVTAPARRGLAGWLERHALAVALAGAAALLVGAALTLFGVRAWN